MTPSFAIYSHGWSIRFRPLLAPQPIANNDNLRFQSAAADITTSGVIAATSPDGSVMRTAIERTQPIAALAVRTFISRGPWLICNLHGGLKALRSLSFLNPCVQDSRQAPHGFFRRFKFSPTSLSSVAHSGQPDRRNGQGVVT